MGRGRGNKWRKRRGEGSRAVLVQWEHVKSHYGPLWAPELCSIDTSECLQSEPVQPEGLEVHI